MTLFDRRNVLAAYRHAEAGGQALYIPRVQPKKGGKVGWIIDHEIERLMATARRLGQKGIAVKRAHLPGQFVEIKGNPLDRAVAECATPELKL